jgi:hypothetical protein
VLPVRGAFDAAKNPCVLGILGIPVRASDARVRGLLGLGFKDHRIKSMTTNHESDRVRPSSDGLMRGRARMDSSNVIQDAV